MDQILQSIGDSLNTIFQSDIVQFGLRAIGLYLVIIWLACAYWAFRDMQQRSDNPILPYVAAAGIILFTPIFFIFAYWIYKLVRPHEKIGEIWERNLAEEALLAEVEFDPPLPELRASDRRRMDHLPDLPHPTEAGLPELQPAGRDGLVAVRLVRQGLRASRGAGRRDGGAAAGP